MFKYKYIPRGCDLYTGELHDSVLIVYKDGQPHYAFIGISKCKP